MDGLIEVLQRDPAFPCFLLDGQVILVDDYLAVRPDRTPAVRRLVLDGRLLVGPWYVLADELLSSGECLVRNLLEGGRRATALGGRLPLGYSPDAFGHPAALPTILAGFGIEYGLLWRGYGGEPGQHRDLFRWMAPDGSSVLVHHLPPAGYDLGAALPADRERLARRWREIDAVLAPRAAAPALLVPAGADHHAPDPALPERTALLNQIAPTDEFRLGSPLEYFAAIPAGASPSTVQGELRFSPRYAWTLQGVHSSRAGLKRAVSEADRLLVRWAEPQAALAEAAGGPDRRPLLRTAWREHLANHFHDTLCGTVADEVADEARVRCADVATQARGILADALHDRLGQDRNLARVQPAGWTPTLVLVNPSAQARRGVVEATVTAFEDHVVVGRPPRRRRVRRPPAAPRLVAGQGAPVPFQVLAEWDGYDRLDSPGHYPRQDRVRAFRVALLSGEVPSLGLVAVRAGPGRPARRVVPGAVHASRAGLRTGWGTVAAPFRGGFALDGRDLLRLESDSDGGDTYTFQPLAGRAVVARWGRPRVAWPGPLVAAVARPFTVPRRVRGTVTLRADAESRLWRVVVEGDNLAGHHRLRVVFPGPPADGRSVADMPFGPVTRTRAGLRRRDYPREWPVDTGPMHRWVSVGGGARGGGLTIMTRGAFEYELTERGELAVTIFRAVGDLSRDDLAARPGHAAWPVATPGAQELGPFRLELGFTPCAVTEESPPAEWAALERLAEEFHSPLGGLMLRYGIAVPDRVSGPLLVGDGLAFSALKPRDEGKGVVARCVNPTREPVAGAWHWPVPVTRAFRARLDETPLERLPVSRDRCQVAFTAAPRAVVTVVIES